MQNIQNATAVTQSDRYRNKAENSETADCDRKRYRYSFTHTKKEKKRNCLIKNIFVFVMGQGM